MTRSRLPIAEINVVPYIDVMLVLLIIFMIATPLLTQGVDVELPKADAEPIISEHNEPMIVTVNEEGEYFLNLATEARQAMTPQSLLNRVAAQVQLAQREGRNQPIWVKGDARVNYGAVVDAMVLLQQAGVAQVGLLTEPAADERALLPAAPVGG